MADKNPLGYWQWWTPLKKPAEPESTEIEVREVRALSASGTWVSLGSVDLRKGQAEEMLGKWKTAKENGEPYFGKFSDRASINFTEFSGISFEPVENGEVLK